MGYKRYDSHEEKTGIVEIQLHNKPMCCYAVALLFFTLYTFLVGCIPISSDL